MSGTFGFLIDSRVLVAAYGSGHATVGGPSFGVSGGVAIGRWRKDFGDSSVRDEHADREKGHRARKPLPHGPGFCGLSHHGGKTAASGELFQPDV